MASACAPRGVRSSRGSLPPFSDGAVEGRIGLDHPLRYRVLECFYESCQVHCGVSLSKEECPLNLGTPASSSPYHGLN